MLYGRATQQQDEDSEHSRKKTDNVRKNKSRIILFVANTDTFWNVFKFVPKVNQSSGARTSHNSDISERYAEMKTTNKS
jgi:hypothetical protein